jgi:hypothetical protein
MDRVWLLSRLDLLNCRSNFSQSMLLGNYLIIHAFITMHIFIEFSITFFSLLGVLPSSIMASTVTTYNSFLYSIAHIKIIAASIQSFKVSSMYNTEYNKCKDLFSKWLQFIVDKNSTWTRIIHVDSTLVKGSTNPPLKNVM